MYDNIVVLLLISCGLFAYIILTLLRSYLKRHENPPKRDLSRNVCVTYLAVMGSGGHTAELICALRSIKSKYYKMRYYVIAETDKLSENKVIELEKELFGYGKYQIYKTPRSREVGQSFISSIWTTLKAFAFAFKIIFETCPQIIFTNGPGTSFPIAFTGFFFDFICYNDCRIFYMESFARVKSLSLTGKILYYSRITDVFIVQWKELVSNYPKTEYMPFYFASSKQLQEDGQNLEREIKSNIYKSKFNGMRSNIDNDHKTF
uniref:Asparagine-linked glycosylation protein 14 n=1 Tax=Rhabditophanes sp. KR3021 TaxID=114890 RepID=A0AC35UGJ8_9BILA